MPNDKDSLLDLHSDIYAGESPFQVVVWIPLVDAYETKSKPIHSCHADWLSPDVLDLDHLQTKMVPSPDWWR